MKIKEITNQNSQGAIDRTMEEFNQLKAENEKLEQTLSEIKDFLEYEFYGKNIWVKEQILQKISKCEVKNDR